MNQYPKRKAWFHSVLDKEVAKRFKKLGNLGEYLTENLLAKAGFKNIKNLNRGRENNKFADLYGERDGQKYIISVKARNKYENNGNLNSRYKLGTDAYEFAREAERTYRAKAAWIAIALEIESGVFDAYFGLLNSLSGNKGIPMTREATQHYESLACKCKFEEFGIRKEEHEGLKNVYKAR